MKISFNSPVVLVFVIIASLELLVDTMTHGAIGSYFTTFGGLGHLVSVQSVLHVFGHINFDHLIGNMTFILLLGPILEEKYGSLSLVLMIMVTAIATSILNALFFNSGLLGASGVVFMMIILSSVTNVKAGTLPATFVLAIVFYFSKELYQSLLPNNVSQFGHILGGCFGGVFGLFFSSSKK